MEIALPTRKRVSSWALGRQTKATRKLQSVEILDESDLQWKIREWGADVVGFANLKGILAAELSHLPSAISIGVRLSDQIVQQIKDGPTMIYAYNVSTANSLLNEIAFKVTNHLQERGFEALPIPASQSSRKSPVLFQHKTAATCAGIGWIGKCALLVHPEYGPRLRLATILTDASLTGYGEPVTESKCGACRSCLEACPAKAVRAVNWSRGKEVGEYFDLRACQEYVNAGEVLLDKPLCGICISACPVGLNRNGKARRRRYRGLVSRHDLVT